MTRPLFDPDDDEITLGELLAGSVLLLITVAVALVAFGAAKGWWL